MAGLVPAIHVLFWFTKVVDARDKPGHDDECPLVTMAGFFRGLIYFFGDFCRQSDVIFRAQ
jgi:hypothetical protein